MKKKILTLILPAVAMIAAACGETKPCDHKDENHDHLCDLCNERISDHIDLDKNHKCDICEEAMGEHADKNNDHNCDYCGEKMSDHADNNHDHNCDVCDEKMSEHTAPNAEGKCDICGEKIADPVVNSVQFLDSSLSLEKGESHTLSVIVDAKYGASSEVEFSSEDESVAKVDSQGKVTAIAAGNTKVWATSKFDSSKKASISVKVIDPEEHHDPVITSVTVSPASASIDEGKTVQLSADVKGQYNYSTEVRWSSNNEEVATVSSTGLVSGLKAGDAVITVTSVQDGTKSAQASIHVSAVAPVENKELEKFNELVASLKTNHNYRLTITSEVESFDSDDNYYDHFTNYNNLVLESDDHSYGLDGYGYIYQKDQGYVDYYRNDTNIVPSGFVSTNPNLKISDFYEIIAENLFLGDYEQDSSNKTKFVTTSEDSMAVAAQFTGFGAYISVGGFARDDSMSALVDIENNQITIKFKYWLHYFDVTEQTHEGLLTIVIKDIGKVNDQIYKDYIENPSYIFETPTEWSSDDKDCFDEKFNKNYPVFPEGLTYAYSSQVNYYDGFEYAIIEDKASGDLRQSYGEALVKDGYSLTGTDVYKKIIKGAGDFDSYTYTVRLKYYGPSVAFPYGVMSMMFRSVNDISNFDSINEFNLYLKSTGRDKYCPLLPDEPTNTGISGFKDSQSSGYAFYTAGWTSVKIADYDKAVAWKNKFVSEMAKFGFTDYNSGVWENYGFVDSTSGSTISLMKFDKSSYKGIIQFRIQITDVDVPLIETFGADIVSIAVSDYKTSFETGSSFSFGGTCTATFSNGATRVLNSSEFVCSGYSMNEEGKQTVTVAYAGDSSIKTTYEIEVKTTREVTKIELGGSPTLQFVKNGTFNHTGLSVKATYDNGDVDYVGNDANCTYDVDLSSTGIKDVTVSYKYHDKTVTVKYQILVNETLTWPSISFESTENLQWADIYDSYGDQEISEFNYNQESSFFVDVYPVEGFSIDSISIKNDPDAQVIYDDETYMYQVIPTINLEMSEIVVCVELSGEEVVKYNVTSATLEHGSITLSGAKYKPGDTVQFTVNPDSGYSIESVSSDPIIVISEVSAGKYQFVMPAEDVELSASFSLIPVAHRIATSVTGSGSINSITVNGVAGTNAMAGDTVQIDAKASDIDVYRVKSAVITTDGGSTVEWTKKAGKYQFTMPEDNITFTVVFEEIPSYAISKDTTHTNITFNSGVTSNTSKPGTIVIFKPLATDVYELNPDSISVTMTETGDKVSCVPGFVTGTYQFTMPEGGVTIHATSELPVTKYAVSVSESIEHGKIELDASEYAEGETVEFEVTPNNGYEIDSVSSDPSLTISEVSDGVYSFVMPAESIELSATFKASATPSADKVYSASVGSVTKFDLSLTIQNADQDSGKGYYVIHNLNKDVEITQYFVWTKNKDGSLAIATDPDISLKTSSNCSTYHLLYHFTGDAQSDINVITFGEGTLSFAGRANNNTSSTTVTLNLED